MEDPINQILFAYGQMIYANDYDNLIKYINIEHINILDRYGKSLLYYVIEFDSNMTDYDPKNTETINNYYQRKRIFKYLLKSGANVNQICNDKTPLSEAIINEQLYYVKKMLKYYGDVKITERINRAMLYTVSNINYVKSYPAVSYKILTLLVDKGIVDINYVDNDGNSALHHCLMVRTKYELEVEQIVYYLIEKSINYDLQNKRGDTALMIAIRNCLTYAVFILLDSGANKTLKNLKGETVQSLAKLCDYSHIVNLIDTLPC